MGRSVHFTLLKGVLSFVKAFFKGFLSLFKAFLWYSYDSFSFVQLQGKHCTKKAFFKENPYEKAFFSTMLALRKALKGKKWEGVIYDGDDDGCDGGYCHVICRALFKVMFRLLLAWFQTRFKVWFRALQGPISDDGSKAL